MAQSRHKAASAIGRYGVESGHHRSLQKASQKFQVLLDLAIQENDERRIRICRGSLAELADSEARLDKIADAGG